MADESNPFFSGSHFKARRLARTSGTYVEAIFPVLYRVEQHPNAKGVLGMAVVAEPDTMVHIPQEPDGAFILDRPAHYRLAFRDFDVEFDMRAGIVCPDKFVVMPTGSESHILFRGNRPKRPKGPTLMEQIEAAKTCTDAPEKV